VGRSVAGPRWLRRSGEDNPPIKTVHFRWITIPARSERVAFLPAAYLRGTIGHPALCSVSQRLNCSTTSQSNLVASSSSCRSRGLNIEIRERARTHARRQQLQPTRSTISRRRPRDDPRPYSFNGTADCGDSSLGGPGLVRKEFWRNDDGSHVCGVIISFSHSCSGNYNYDNSGDNNDNNKAAVITAVSDY